MAYVLGYRPPFPGGLCNQINWPLRSNGSWMWHRNLHRTRSAVTGSSVTEMSRLQFFFTVGSKVVPHPNKVEKGGEDAFFTNGSVLSVADGVSGWAEANVDPALFSQEFVSHLAVAASLEDVQRDPKTLLAKAHAATVSVGAATAIVATLLGQEGLLRIANVGDCGLRIVRDGKVFFATSPQQHYFDCPFQFSSELGGQTAEDATVYEVQIQDGDTVIMGSDGLFDNVFDHDIAATVSLFGGRDQEAVDKTAMALATLANRNSKDSKYASPYSIEAIAQGYDVPIWKKILGEKLTGGKVDDITVLVGVVGVSEILCQNESEGWTQVPSVSELQREDESVTTDSVSQLTKS